MNVTLNLHSITVKGNYTNKTIQFVQKAANGIKKQLPFSQAAGLRSMQHIKGIEREIIEAYRNELTHEIWGNPQKLREWAEAKSKELTEHNYISDRFSAADVEQSRNDMVKAWADVVNNNVDCQNNPFLKLKIMKSITGNLKEDNGELPPQINQKILGDAIFIVKKRGIF